MKSPLTIGYNDLIEEQERLLANMDKNYPAMITEGKINGHTAAHRKECARVLIRLLRKHKKDPQLNMNELFERL